MEYVANLYLLFVDFETAFDSLNRNKMWDDIPGHIIIIIISCHRFSFFPGTSPLEPVVNPTTQASRLSL
jgi:hypothetical protein